MKETIKVLGMDCASCAVKVEKKVSSLEGVLSAEVDLFGGELGVEYEPEQISTSAIADGVRALGYSVGEKDRQVTVLKVDGLDCATEEQIIRKKLEGMDGVHRLDFDLIGGRLSVEHSLSAHPIMEEISKAGFTARLTAEGDADKPAGKASVSRKEIYATIVAGLFIALGAGAEQLMTDWISISFYVVAMLLAGSRIAKKGYYSIRSLSLDMNFLMSAAVIGAAVIGEWLEGAVVIFLFQIAELLEAGSLERARRAIGSLMELAPDTAWIQSESGGTSLAAVEDIVVGMNYIVKPGERLPLDGVLVEGSGYVDQSPITGESMPVRKEEGEPLFAGSINGDTALVVKVTRTSSESTIARIIKLVDEARKGKAPVERFVDRFARYYTPLVVALSAALFLVPTLISPDEMSIWFYRSLVLLVVACPCALVISTPVTIVSGLARAARSGILVKGGDFLEVLSKVKAVALDKTGTITEGSPGVMEVIQLDAGNEEELLALAAAVETASEHPVAQAVVREAEERKISLKAGSGLHNHPGEGAHAEVEGRQVYVGNHAFFEKSGLCTPETEDRIESVERSGCTAVLVWEAGRVLGIIAVQDRIRESTRHAVEELRSAGVERVVMLTGDNELTAASISEQAGITEYIGGLMPEGKQKEVEILVENGFVTAMVGDGVNDTPALAAASIGIAMGEKGTDQALEAADAALMSGDLTKLPYVINLSRRALRIVKWNIGFALGLKVVFMLLAATGQATLWMAVGADAGASLLVIFNGMRVLGYGHEGEQAAGQRS